MTGPVWAGDEFIASVFPNAPKDWDAVSEFEGLEEQRANARLIAAAPELLDVLRELQQRWHHTIGCSSSAADHALNARAFAAIAKATGGDQ